MKYFFTSFLVLTTLLSVSVAQKKGMGKAVIQTPGVIAEPCKVSIENFLVHEYGVASVKADYRRHTVTVTWYADRTNIENIKTALANMGYDADNIKAEPDAVKRLRPECRPAPAKADSAATH